MTDVLVRAIDAQAGLRVLAAVTTDLCVEGARRHGARGIGACALGRGLTSGLLLATLTKGAERVTLQLQGDGPLGGLTVDATLDSNGTGEVRGFLLRPEGATAECHGRGRVVAALGRAGLVNVTRDIGLKERYQGQVAMLTGEIDEDVERYLRESEQVPSALACDVLLVDGIAITAAAGVLVQALPGADSLVVREAQHAARSGAVFSYLQGGGRDPRGLAQAVYGRPLDFLAEQPLRFQCRCSAQRIHDMMKLLAVIDLDELVADPGFAEVTCNYCSARYVVQREELETIRAELAGGPRVRN